jgi:tRNA dimethylallyltransferase
MSLYICLTDDRQVLYDRINQRVDKMMVAGLLDEVSWLYQEHPEAQALWELATRSFFHT